MMRGRLKRSASDPRKIAITPKLSTHTAPLRKPNCVSLSPSSFVICGENDPSRPLPLSLAIAAAMPAARLEVVAGLNHLPHFERPDLVNPLLRDFLAGLPA